MNIGRENESIEFKKSTSELKLGVVSISAILNKHGKGTLYFGVKDNGEVCGMQIGKDTTRDIASEIRNNIKPEFNFDVNVKNSSNGREFIEVTFNGNRSPYSAHGKYYLRFSDQDRQMTTEELERFFKEKIKDYSIWENEKTDILFNEADENLVKNAVNKGYENKRIPYKYDTLQNVLNKFGVLSKDKEYLTNAGNVLFSKNRPILLKLATFATESKDTFLKLEHFEGNIYECIDKSLSYIISSINWKITLDGSARRKETPEIPSKALREIVVNAFCHAQYDSNTTFEICIFKDRVSIYSPGFFPSGFTPEDFALKHETPIMLNPKIVNVLFKTNEIESFGYGFDTVFKECFNAHVDFKYENTKSGFRFTFYRNLSEKNKRQKLNKTETEVYESIKDNNYVRTNEIASSINKSQKTVLRAIKKLKDLEYIERIGNERDGYWKVIDK